MPTEHQLKTQIRNAMVQLAESLDHVEWKRKVSYLAKEIKACADSDSSDDPRRKKG